MIRALLADNHAVVRAGIRQFLERAGDIEVTRWLRANHREIGVLALTAYDDDPYVVAILQAGANGYVLKTATPHEIIQAVRQWLQEREVSPVVPSQGGSCGV